MANCWRLIGSQSTLAPLSQIPTIPLSTVGKIGQKAGLETPFILPTLKTAPTRTAPVDPTLTKPFTSSVSFNKLIAFTNELSFLYLIASVGLSLHDTTSGAWTISSLDSSNLYFLNSSLRIASSPVMTICKSFFWFSAFREERI